ncbi:MAG: branched-chain amino acid ABC transporter permease [Chloroflexi bacterium]|nr:MAG: branched-chain amino acid ABC transporter permease [Chloroflexota bacterium]
MSGLLAILWVIYLGAEDPAGLIATLVIGITDGAMFALVALGYTMVYGIIELINFAHGDVFTLGGFLGLPLLGLFGITSGTKFAWVYVPILVFVFVLVMGLNGLVNITIERVAYRPLRNAPRLAPLITAIGMSFILEGAMYLWRGPVSLRFPNLLPDTVASCFTSSAGHFGLNSGSTAAPLIDIGVKDVAVVISTVVLVILLSVFINRTKLGKAMRATAQDRDAAQLMGIDINRTISATFFIGAALAGAGGMIWALYFNSIRFDLGFTTGLIAFTAAVLGGIGNIEGAALGGLLIGIIRALNERYLSASWSDVVIFGILIMVLVFRPTGLLGMRVPEK